MITFLVVGWLLCGFWRWWRDLVYDTNRVTTIDVIGLYPALVLGPLMFIVKWLYDHMDAIGSFTIWRRKS